MWHMMHTTLACQACCTLGWKYSRRAPDKLCRPRSFGPPWPRRGRPANSQRLQTAHRPRRRLTGVARSGRPRHVDDIIRNERANFTGDRRQESWRVNQNHNTYDHHNRCSTSVCSLWSSQHSLLNERTFWLFARYAPESHSLTSSLFLSFLLTRSLAELFHISHSARSSSTNYDANLPSSFCAPKGNQHLLTSGRPRMRTTHVSTSNQLLSSLLQPIARGPVPSIVSSFLCFTVSDTSPVAHLHFRSLLSLAFLV